MLLSRNCESEVSVRSNAEQPFGSLLPAAVAAAAKQADLPSLQEATADERPELI